MRNYYRILYTAIALILCTALTSCASRIPSMYKNISSPDNHSASSEKNNGQSDTNQENEDSSSQSVSDLPASVAVSGYNAQNSRNNGYYFVPAPGLYSSVIPYVSIPESSSSSSSDNSSSSGDPGSSESSDNSSSSNKDVYKRQDIRCAKPLSSMERTPILLPTDIPISSIVNGIL